MKIVHFNGYEGFPPDGTYGSKPEGLAFTVGSEMPFDAALTALTNRTCNPVGDDDARDACLREHDGECFAKAFCARENATLPQSEPSPFQVLYPPSIGPRTNPIDTAAAGQE